MAACAAWSIGSGAPSPAPAPSCPQVLHIEGAVTLAVRHLLVKRLIAERATVKII
ncbi:hypothetical protein GCM10018784_70470 [Streptomyces hydrogenans]|nr:hypothetical protein GCM10018784_70470 [Streptomyces hydrogenans]